jgi:peroxiredoxin
MRSAHVRALAVLLACAASAAVAAPAATPAPALRKAPDFSAPRLDSSGMFTLSGLRGVPMLLDFWATWCAPCWRALDASERIQAEYGSKGLQVLGVNIDEDVDKAREFAARRAPTLAMVSDARGHVADMYAVHAMPVTVVLDCEGRIAARFEGFRDGVERQIERAVAAVTASPCESRAD